MQNHFLTPSQKHHGNFITTKVFNSTLHFLITISNFLDELEKYDQMAKEMRRQDRTNSI
ncbi:hypothetical protein [Photobacterium ganghwense]|uniref:hypothetical protein n=1 Tax=Photobacterium ganghwense TaxID=320778 RepID=UPI001C2CEA0E|nr:hypothetical protein [Photobacterium ganghwense]